MNDSERTSAFEYFLAAIEAVGGKSAAARVCDCTPANIGQHVDRQNPCPAEYVLAMEKASGVSCHDLRPDIYPIHRFSENTVPNGRTGGAGFASTSTTSQGSAPVSADEKTSPSDDHQLQRNRGASPPAGHRPVQQMVGDKAS